MDKVLYVSEVQRAALEPGYVGQASRLPVGGSSGAVSASQPEGSTAGDVFDRRVLGAGGSGNRQTGRLPHGLRWHITGNYVAPSEFP